MGRESHALLAGLFVVVLGTALVLIGIWLGNVGNEYDTYVVTTRYAVSGLRPESTVYFRGVEAGKVSGIEIDPADPQNIRVFTHLNKGLPITDHTYAKLRVQALTGLAQVELDNAPGDAEALPTREKEPAVIPMHPSLLDQLAGTGEDLLGQAQQLLIHFNELFNQENRDRLQQIAANLGSASARLITLEDRLDRALAEVPAVSADARKTLARIDGLTGDIKTLSRRMSELTEDARGLVATGRTAGDALSKHTLPRLDTLLEEMQSAATRVKRLSTQLDEDPQSLLRGAAPEEPGPGEAGYREPQ
ncbi:MlaD family protein [Methylococcus sp. EFPC2]|uniref:MlaD family protein n=1 Tax=Methylococcus sp. EFPC2 TaxID=2812648 RepID=UPI0019680A69|nr:MlaD family protein [Methylococcus sp. EFPC2]QSA98152.1 MCE family protein [Methylococcus sp. EFPC2]